MIGQKRAKTSGSPPTLFEPEPDGGMKIIDSQNVIRLLGVNLPDHMGWDAHIESGEDALLPTTRKKLGILKHIGKSIPIRSRKLLAEGIIISRIRYIISIWGSTNEKLMRNTQTLLNDCGRFVTGRTGRRTNKNT